MPFAVIGKAKRWPKARLLWIICVSGMGHVASSAALGVIGILLGFSLSRLKGIEGSRQEIGLWLLIGFGIAYMLWGIKKAGEHKHAHIEGERLKAKTAAMWTLFAVVILGPCEPLIPLVFLGYNYGWAGVILVTVVFSAVTITMMLLQGLLSFMGIQLIKNELAERYSHAFAGLAIALTGVFIMLTG